MSEGHGLPSERLEFAVQLPRLDPDGTGDIIKVWAKLACYCCVFFSHWYSTLRGRMMKTHRLLIMPLKDNIRCRTVRPESRNHRGV